MIKSVGRMPVFLLGMALLIGLAAAQLILPARQFSDIENRPLQQLEAPDWQGVRTGRWMQRMETFVADQFPGRDRWMDVQALADLALLKKERNGILQGKDGWRFEESANLPIRTAQLNLEALDALGAATGVPVSLMLVPMSSAVYPDKLPAWYLPDDQAALMENLYAQAIHLETVNVLPFMQGYVSCVGRNPLYFRTDHHWTVYGAQYGYQALVDAWQLSGLPWPMDTARSEGFYGTYFSRAPYPFATGEEMVFEAPQGVTLEIDGETMPGLYSPEQMAARDKYAALLWGNHGQLTLRSDAGGGTLLVIKDSYANMLLPYLAQHFSRIEAVDPRYFVGDLAAYLEETEADRILCLYGLTTFLTDRNLLLHSHGWGG